MLPNNNEITELSNVTEIKSKQIGLLKLLKMKEIRHELLISIIMKFKMYIYYNIFQISQQLSGYYAVIFILSFNIYII